MRCAFSPRINGVRQARRWRTRRWYIRASHLRRKSDRTNSPIADESKSAEQPRSNGKCRPWANRHDASGASAPARRPGIQHMKRRMAECFGNKCESDWLSDSSCQAMPGLQTTSLGMQPRRPFPSHRFVSFWVDGVQWSHGMRRSHRVRSRSGMCTPVRPAQYVARLTRV